jgi:cell division transport system ATP-binding protein
MISFDQVNLTFPLGNTGLSDVSFEIDENEFIFLVGKSGAGKTTILKLLLRTVYPNSGSIFVNDFDISDPGFQFTNDLRKQIGVVFQDFKILQEKNVYDNIAISLRVKGYHEEDIVIEVSEALDVVGLSHKEQVFPAQLSAGELQRIAIARAIVGDRNIILADEPTGNLDPKTTWEIMKVFRKLIDKKTIIFATHNMDIVNSFKRRVLVLEDGKLTKDIRKGGYEL